MIIYTHIFMKCPAMTFNEELQMHSEMINLLADEVEQEQRNVNVPAEYVRPPVIEPVRY